MRLLGIDYGTKRVGVALSDEGGQMAFPHAVYENDKELLSRVITLAREEKAGTIVIGRSHTLAGAPNAVQDDIERFAELLRTDLDIPIVLENEQFTTQAALRIQGRTEMTDASAAALILDAYIQKRTKRHD